MSRRVGRKRRAKRRKLKKRIEREVLIYKLMGREKYIDAREGLLPKQVIAGVMAAANEDLRFEARRQLIAYLDKQFNKGFYDCFTDLLEDPQKTHTD